MSKEYLYIRSSNNTAAFKNFIRSLGGDPTLLLQELYGDKIDAQEKLNFIPWSTLVKLYEGSSVDFDEPYFGMKWAMAMPKDFRSSGPHVFFASISKNIEQFAKIAIEFQRLHTNGVSYSTHVDVEKKEFLARLDFHPMATYSRQFCEHVMGVLTLMGTRFIPNFQIKAIHFQHSKPEDMSVYQELFRCPVKFNCNENLLVLDHKWFKYEKTNHAKNALKPFLRAFIDWRVRKNLKHKATVAMTLAELLPSLLGVKHSDIETVSKALNMSPKKLQRLLRDEGTNYSEVLDGVRRNIASRLLEESDMTIMHVAQLLDYSSDKTFNTAFKRWFNMPPGQFRNLKRKNNDKIAN